MAEKLLFTARVEGLNSKIEMEILKDLSELRRGLLLFYAFHILSVISVCPGDNSPVSFILFSPV